MDENRARRPWKEMIRRRWFGSPLDILGILFFVVFIPVLAFSSHEVFIQAVADMLLIAPFMILIYFAFRGLFALVEDEEERGERKEDSDGDE